MISPQLFLVAFFGSYGGQAYSIHTSLMHLPHIMGIKLAYPVTDVENFERSILIGAGHS